MPRFFISNANQDRDIWTVLAQQLITPGHCVVAGRSILNPVSNLDRDLKKTVLEVYCSAFRLMQNNFLSGHSIKNKHVAARYGFAKTNYIQKKGQKNE